MTIENKILEYLYYLPSAPRKGLKMAFPNENYNSLMRAYRGACEKGYIEKFTEKNTCRIRLTTRGKQRLKESGIDLDSKKRKKALLKTDGFYKERIERIDMAANMMKSAGIETGEFKDFLEGKTDLTENWFYSSADIAAAIKQKKIRGEEVTKNESRYVGIATINGKVAIVYNTLGRLMRILEPVERERQRGLQRVIKEITGSDIDIVNLVIGRSSMMIPKIITGDKYGRTCSTEAAGYLKENLLTCEVLSRLSPYNYFVANDTSGVQELKRLVKFGFDESRIDEVKKQWISRYSPDATAVKNRFTIEGYLGDERFIAIMPVVNIGYLNLLKSSTHRITIVCNKGRQNSISKVLGESLEKALDISTGAEMKFVPYKNSGERLDGLKPFTKKEH